jgi:hypothetical protein
VRRFGSVMAAFVVLTLARDAAAQQNYVNLQVGRTLSAPRGASGGSERGFAVAFGQMNGMVGAETEFGYFPEPFGTGTVRSSHFVSASGNILVGPTIRMVKIYGAFGFGDLYVSATSASSDSGIGNNYLTLNGGAGVAVFFTPHIGVRGDLRYYRAMGVTAADFTPVGLDVERLDFWRQTVGLTLKF